jgi:hypothetical protein
MIKVLTVNYETPDLILRLVESFRQYHDNEIIIIDGSNPENYEKTKSNLDRFENIQIHHFNYNLHHGPSMAYGIRTMDCDKIMVIDSDVIIYKEFLSKLETYLDKELYGVGDIQEVDANGFNVGGRGGAIGLMESEQQTGIKYLHPAFMLINKEVALQWPMPVKHGAPMIETMKAIHKANKSNILKHVDWVFNDFRNEPKMYFRHDWLGTVNRVGGYNL